MKRLLAEAKRELRGLAVFGFPDPKSRDTSGAFFRIAGGGLVATFEGTAVESIGLEIIARDTDPDALVELADSIIARIGSRTQFTELTAGQRAEGGAYNELRLVGTFK